MRILVMSGSWNLEVLEDLREPRHDPHHDEDQDAHGETDDDDGVDQGALDFAFQGLGPFLELGETFEDDFQRTAGLAGLDHVDVEAVEGLGRLGHRLGERGPALDLVADVDQAVFQGPAGGLLLENLQASQDRQAGVLENRELAGEGGQHLRPDAAEGKGLSLSAAFLQGAGLSALLDGELRDEVPHLLDRRLRFLLIGGLDDVLDLLAGLVHGLKVITWHDCCSFVRSRKRLECIRCAKPQAVLLGGEPPSPSTKPLIPGP